MKKRWFFIGLLPISIFLTVLARKNINFAEYYAVNIYPLFINTAGIFSYKSNKSLAELLIFAFIITIIISAAVTIIKSIKHKKGEYFKKYIFVLLSFLSAMYFLYVLFCGINYYRYEFTVYSGLEIQKSTKEDLINLCEILINDANECRKKLGTDNLGTAELSDNNYYETANRAKSAMNVLSDEYKILKGNYPAPKIVRQSKLMSYLGITGVFFPFTFEANVNVHIPPYQIPSVMLHELVHLRGFMREDEANFISYLACIKSGYDDFYYSGTMTALVHSMNALYMADYDAFVNAYNMYSEDVKKDMNYSRNYWRQFETRVQDAANKVNDTYLKANNQDDGVKSYGRMVDLLLAYYR